MKSEKKNGRKLRNIGIYIYIEIEKGIRNGTENGDGRLGALPSTTAC